MTGCQIITLVGTYGLNCLQLVESPLQNLRRHVYHEVLGNAFEDGPIAHPLRDIKRVLDAERAMSKVCIIGAVDRMHYGMDFARPDSEVSAFTVTRKNYIDGFDIKHVYKDEILFLSNATGSRQSDIEYAINQLKSAANSYKIEGRQILEDNIKAAYPHKYAKPNNTKFYDHYYNGPKFKGQRRK